MLILAFVIDGIVCALIGFGIAAICAAAGQDSRDREYVQSLLAAVKANPSILNDWERASREY